MIRGNASDYALWARLYKSPKWSYRGFLPYLCKVERYHTKGVDANDKLLRNSSGPIRDAFWSEKDDEGSAGHKRVKGYSGRRDS